MAPPIQGTPQIEVITGTTVAEFEGNVNSWLQNAVEVDGYSIQEIQYFTHIDVGGNTFYANIFYIVGIPVV